MRGCLHLIYSADGFRACRLRAGAEDTMVLMLASALPSSLPATPADTANPALHWLEPAEPGEQPAGEPGDTAISAIGIQDLVRLTERYDRIVTWD
jgi:hypothetical protein